MTQRFDRGGSSHMPINRIGNLQVKDLRQIQSLWLKTQ